MAWRAVNSILVLRDQANAAAPNRAKGADGTVCDQNHPSDSDHCPHYVEGLGNEIVTALDLTHDPAGGFDSYKFAETLRTHRDKRIKYVISNKRMFSSYAVTGYAAWTWRPYSGTDPHTGHVHISTLDDVISDTTTPWNLEGFVNVTTKLEHNTAWMVQRILEMEDPAVIPKDPAIAGTGSQIANELAQTLWAIQDDLEAAKTRDEELKTLLLQLTQKVEDAVGADGVYTASGQLVLNRIASPAPTQT